MNDDNWSIERDDIMVDMWSKGMTGGQIAKHFGDVSAQFIWHRIRKVERERGLIYRAAGREKIVPFDEILRTVCFYYGITKEDLFGQSKGLRLCEARHIAMSLAYKLTALSTTQIAERFGDRDHSTIVHGIKNADKRFPGFVELFREKIMERKAERAAA